MPDPATAATAPFASGATWPLDMIIDGRSEPGQGAAIAVENPATEAVIVEFPGASVAQVDAAANAARQAFDSGRWDDPALRRRVLNRIADLMEAQTETFVAALIAEVGTPDRVARGLQFAVAIALFRHYAAQAEDDRTRQLDPIGAVGARTGGMVRYLPVGVVAAITAYNYPLFLMAHKIAPALAVGCTTVVLPSPQTPLTTLMFGTLLAEAGVPAGVINIVVGGPDVGRALSEHPQVDKVSFTGSVAVGAAVMAQAAASVKGVVLELGGKSATLVLPDADIAAISPAIHMRYSLNAGQGCSVPSRLLIPESLVEEFIALAPEIHRQLQIGDPADPATVVGPLINRRQRDFVEGHVARAVEAGGRIVAGGGRPGIAKGYYMNPVLIAGLDNDAEICRTEMFGPVATIITYRDLDEAIAIVNDSHLGLSGAIYGPLDQAIEVSKHFRSGAVAINGGGGMRFDAPVGGFKQSGIGREGGPEGLLEFLETQQVQWPMPA